MDREEVLQKTSNKKAYVGEMEKEKIGKCIDIALIATGVIAVAFIIVLALLQNAAGAFAIVSICFFWAGLFYTLQFFIAKRPWPVLIGSVLDGLAFIFFLIRFILFVTGVWC